jgi:predicted ATPase
MFKKFRVQNFLSLKDTAVQLSPLTVLIGPNGSGKSAFFRALTTFCRLFTYAVRGGKEGEFQVSYGVGLDQAVWRGGTALPIIFEVWFDDEHSSDPDYTLELHRGNQGWSVRRERFRFDGDWTDTSVGFKFPTSSGEKNWPGPYFAPVVWQATWRAQVSDLVTAEYLKPLRDLRQLIGAAYRYRPSAVDIASFDRPPRTTPTRKINMSDVNESGGRLASVLSEIFKGDKPTFDQVANQVTKLFPHVQGMEEVSSKSV